MSDDGKSDGFKGSNKDILEWVFTILFGTILCIACAGGAYWFVSGPTQGDYPTGSIIGDTRYVISSTLNNDSGYCTAALFVLAIAIMFWRVISKNRD